MPDNNSDKKFLKYKARILAIGGGGGTQTLPYDITVPAYRGYAENEVIPAGTPLMDIIRKEFQSAPVSYTINITSTGSGTVTPSGAQSVIRGGSLTVTATPASGNQIKSFKVDGAAQTSPYVFTNVQANHAVAVEFEAIPVTSHIITASAGTGGLISPSGAVSVNDGGSKTFTITADSGKVIKDVKVDGTSVGAVSTYTFSNVTSDHTIAAEFENAPVTAHTVTGTAGSNGSIAPSGAQSVADGGSISFTATPASGYVVDKWQLDGADQSETGTTFTVSNVTSDHTVNVLFKAAPVTSHTITVTAGANGTISPAGPVTVSDGADQVFTITANSGYEIEDVKVDSVSQGAITTYTFSNVVADHTIEATFKVVPVQVYHVVIADATSGLSGYGTISPAAGTHDVNVGSSQAVVATPSAGFKIKSFKVDSTEQAIADPTTAFTYTVSGVAADATVNIIVEFEQIPSGNIYTQAYTPGNGRVWQEPTADIIVTGDPTADSAAAVAQIQAGTYAWKSKLQSKSAETFLIAKSLARITSIKANGTDEVLDHVVFDEKSITLDGVDYWCYFNKGLGGGGNNYVMKGE